MTVEFTRFTERSRHVVVVAQQTARDLKHNYIGTEHILMGLLLEEEGIAARVLNELGITAEAVKAQVERIVGRGEAVTDEQLPFTVRSKKVLEVSLREALSLGHNYIGTEHILLGLVRENEGVAARILLDFDADSEKIRNEVIRFISPPQDRHRKPIELGAVVEHEGRVARVVGIAGGRSIIFEYVGKEPCSECGALPRFSLLEHSRLFRDTIRPVTTVEEKS